jgi:ABC-2 type transport system permease protein
MTEQPPANDALTPRSARSILVRHARASWAIAWRLLSKMLRNPAFLLPSMLMPVFFFTAFAGGLVAVSNSPGFDYPSYTTFQYVFVLIQSAVFGGVFAGFSIAADFESGFARRLMLGTRDRSALVIGYTISALARAFIVWGVVTVIALLAGAKVTGSGLDITETISVAMLTNIAALLFSCGVAMRMRTMQAAPLIQLPAFLLIFTAPVYVPRQLLEGWVAFVSDFNPLTAVLEASREWVIGGSPEALLAYGAAVGLAVLMGVWAITGLRRAERAA